MSESYLERITAALIKEAGIPAPIREYRLCEERRWRGDFVWLLPDGRKVLLEVMGGTFKKVSGHVSGTGYQNDCDKANEAALMGFLVLRVTKYHIINGQMLKWVKRALGVDMSKQ